MNKISAYLITKNEEARLPETLKAVSQVADEIIVVDSGSTDKTLEIAKKYNARIFSHEWISYANQKNFAQNQCKNKWLLSLDADEVLSPALIDEISALKTKEPQYKAYNLQIADIFPGMKYKRGTRTYKIIRLYNRDYATMHPDLLTEDRIALTQKVPVGTLRAPVYHHSFLSISRQVSKLNKYTDEVQQVILKKKKRYSKIRLCFEFPRQFFHYYIIKMYIIHGMWGFISAMNLAYARFLKIAKYFEKEKLGE